MPIIEHPKASEQGAYISSLYNIILKTGASDGRITDE